MSISRPNSLAPPGDVDRFKEVIHIPCPKRMSNGQGVAALQGQQEFSPSEFTDDEQVFRVAKDNRRYQEISPPSKTNQSPSQQTDLNIAVKQNHQWLISSQGGAQQQSAQNNEQTPLSSPTQYIHDPSRPTSNVNQLQFTPGNNYYVGQSWPSYVVPPIDKPAEATKGSQKQVNVNKYDQPSRQQQMDNRRIKMKFEGNQANSVPQILQMANSNGQYSSPQVYKPQDVQPNNGLNQHPSMTYEMRTPPALPPSRNEIVLPKVQEPHQYQNNAHNVTYEPPNNFFHAIDSHTLMPPYSNSSYDLTSINQQPIYPHNLPNNTNLGVNNVFKHNNASMPSGPPLNYGYNTAREQPIPGQQHNNYKYGNRPSLEGGINVLNGVNGNQNDFVIDPENHIDAHAINHQQHMEYQKMKSGTENWQEFNNPSDFAYDQSEKNSLTISNQVGNRDKTGNQPNAEKPAHGLAALKGFFGKHNKDEMKGRQSAGNEPKPPKSKGHSENLLSLSAINMPTGNVERIAEKVCVGKTERALINGKSGVVVVVEKANGFDNAKNNVPSKTQGNSIMKNDHFYNPVEVVDLPRSQDAPASVAVFPQQLKANLNLSSDFQNYNEARNVIQKKQGNVSRSLSHILSVPMTVEPHMFTNKGLRVISKVPLTEEATYHPFMGFVPARNDEAFYDKKNLNFLGPIDHPPLINLKRNKARKPDKRIKGANRHFKRVSGKFRDEFYSEPADFHSDMTAEDFPHQRKGSKRVRNVRKCHQNHKWQHIKGQNKRGLHRLKESSLRSGH